MNIVHFKRYDKKYEEECVLYIFSLFYKHLKKYILT